MWVLEIRGSVWILPSHRGPNQGLTSMVFPTGLNSTRENLLLIQVSIRAVDLHPDPAGFYSRYWFAPGMLLNMYKTANNCNWALGCCRKPSIDWVWGLRLLKWRNWQVQPEIIFWPIFNKTQKNKSPAGLIWPDFLKGLSRAHEKL